MFTQDTQGSPSQNIGGAAAPPAPPPEPSLMKSKSRSSKTSLVYFTFLSSKFSYGTNIKLESVTGKDRDKTRMLLETYHRQVTSGELCGGDCPNDGITCPSGVCRAHLRQVPKIYDLNPGSLYAWVGFFRRFCIYTNKYTTLRCHKLAIWADKSTKNPS